MDLAGSRTSVILARTVLQGVKREVEGEDVKTAGIGRVLQGRYRRNRVIGGEGRGQV